MFSFHLDVLFNRATDQSDWLRMGKFIVLAINGVNVDGSRNIGRP